MSGKKIIKLNEAQLNMLINESNGVFDGCMELAEKIADEIYDKWVKNKGEGEKLRPLFIPCGWAQWGQIVIRPTNENLRAAYVLDTEKVDGTFIFVNPKIVDFKNESAFLSTLMHELSHAYKDQMKRMNGDSEKKTSDRIGYNKNFNYRFNVALEDRDALKDNLSGFLYVTSQIEVGSYFAGMFGKLWYSNVEIETPKEAYDVIKSTKEFKAFTKAINMANEWASNTDRESQYNLLSYVNELTNKKFTTYNQFVKFTNEKAEMVRKKMKQLIPKMIMRYMNAIENEEL